MHWEFFSHVIMNIYKSSITCIYCMQWILFACIAISRHTYGDFNTVEKRGRLE